MADTALSSQLADSQHFLRTIIKSSWIAYFISALFQVIFFPELVNLVVILLIGIGWLVYVYVFMRTNIWRSYLFSSFVIFGFSTTHLLLPLLFTTIEGKAVINNLDYPQEVFVHSLLAMFVLVVAHAFYRFLVERSSGSNYSIMNKVGFFTPPNDLQLWMMGLVGLGSIYYIFFMVPDVGRSVTGTPFDKTIQAMSIFAYAPYLTLCGPLYGRKSKDIKSTLIPLGIFTLGLFAMAVGRNSTGALMIGFTGVAFCYVGGAFIGEFKLKIFTIKNFLIAGIAVWFLVGPLADLRTAMVIVRGDRTELPAEVLIKQTLETFNDKEAIKERREYDNDDSEQDPDWDERYLDNVFTARFANVKFNDLSLSRAEVLGEYDPDMQEYALDYFLGGFPDPVIKFFNFDVDKDLTFSISNGDFIYLVSGGQGPREVYRVGHFAGIGMATFGWWYLGIFGVGMVFVFYLLDKFQQRKSLQGDGTDAAPLAKFSLCGLISMNYFYQFTQVESVSQIGIFIVRGWLQICILYLLLFYISKVLSASGLKKFKWGTATN